MTTIETLKTMTISEVSELKIKTLVRLNSESGLPTTGKTKEKLIKQLSEYYFLADNIRIVGLVSKGVVTVEKIEVETIETESLTADIEAQATWDEAHPADEACVEPITIEEPTTEVATGDEPIGVKYLRRYREDKVSLRDQAIEAGVTWQTIAKEIKKVEPSFKCEPWSMGKRKVDA